MKILGIQINSVDLFICMPWTVRYRNISSLCTSAYLEYLYSSPKYFDELKSYEYWALKETPVLVTDILMTLQKRSPFLDRVNEIINRLTGGAIAAYLEKFKPVTKSFCKTKSNISESLPVEYCAFNINNMQSACFLLLFHRCLILISFVIMFFFKYIFSNSRFTLV
jgi:hypothetical protein